MQVSIDDVRFKGRQTFVTLSAEGYTGQGSSKCMKQDKYSPEIGFNLAYVRALIAMTEKRIEDLRTNETTWINRAVTQEQYEARKA